MNINNVENCNIWNAIQDTVNRRRVIGWRKVDDYDNVHCCLFEKDWLTNIVSKHDLANLLITTPIVIASQTGTGKTTLVFQHMLAVAKQEGKKILHLSNRTLLSRQMKERCMVDEKNNTSYVSGIQVKDFKKYYTEKYIKENTDFGGVDVITYQSFVCQHDEINVNNYSFVVLDECHAFVSDAPFNALTEEILDIIVEKFSGTRRVYLTATPEECLDAIYDKELYVAEKQADNGCTLNLKVYVMQEDYRYLLPYFFYTKEFIVNKIQNSSENDNWIIFVRDKKTGMELKERLQELSGGVMYITAESDKEDVLFQELIAKENLPKRILITTRVLDVGVNIRTSNLKMVIFETDIVETKQMIGRKRIEPTEELEVYFHIPSYKELMQRQAINKKELLKQIENVKKCDMSKTGYITDFSKYYPLYCYKGVKANHLSLVKRQYDQRYFDALIIQLDLFKDEEEKYQEEYASMLLEKFPGQMHDPLMMLELIEKRAISNDMSEQVSKLVSQFVGNEISKERFVVFSEQLQEITGDYRRGNHKNRGVMKYKTLSEVLPMFGYSVKSNKTNPVTYQIKILDEKEAVCTENISC